MLVSCTDKGRAEESRCGGWEIYECRGQVELNILDMLRLK